MVVRTAAIATGLLIGGARLATGQLISNPALRHADSVAFRIVASGPVDTLGLRLSATTALRKAGVVVQNRPRSTGSAVSLVATIQAQPTFDERRQPTGALFLVFLRADQLSVMDGEATSLTVWFDTMDFGLTRVSDLTRTIANSLRRSTQSFIDDYQSARRFQIRKPPS